MNNQHGGRTGARVEPLHVKHRHRPDDPHRMDVINADENRISLVVKLRAIEDPPEINNWISSLKTATKIITELTCCYPFTFQRCKYFQTDLFVNLMNSLKKRFLPRRIIEKLLDVACEFNGQLSNDAYPVPDAKTACRNFISRGFAISMQSH